LKIAHRNQSNSKAVWIERLAAICTSVLDYFKRNSTKWGMSAAYRFHLELGISSGDFSLPNFNRILNFQLYVILKLWEVHLLANSLELRSTRVAIKILRIFLPVSMNRSFPIPAVRIRKGSKFVSKSGIGLELPIPRRSPISA